MAGGKGVEPLFTESESVVLPLNDPPIFSKNVTVPVTRVSEWKYILTQKSPFRTLKSLWNNLK